MKRLKKMLCMVMALVMILTVVNVSDVNATAKPKINKKKVTIRVGNTYQLKVKNYKGKVKWYSDSGKIVSISKKGKIKAKKVGKATVYAQSKNFLLWCDVKIKKKKSSITNTYNTVSKKQETETEQETEQETTVSVEPQLNIELPSVPQKCYIYSQYSIGTTTYTKINWDGTITNARIEKTYREFDNCFLVELYISGTKISGFNDSISIGWKLYDENKNVVDSGSIITPAISAGESFVDSSTFIGSVKPGNYKLVLQSNRKYN